MRAASFSSGKDFFASPKSVYSPGSYLKGRFGGRDPRRDLAKNRRRSNPIPDRLRTSHESQFSSRRDHEKEDCSAAIRNGGDLRNLGIRRFQSKGVIHVVDTVLLPQ